jgi:hypothetical protein
MRGGDSLGVIDTTELYDLLLIGGDIQTPSINLPDELLLGYHLFHVIVNLGVEGFASSAKQASLLCQLSFDVVI